MTAAASSSVVIRGSSGEISRKTPEMKSLVDGSMSTSDEMPYQDRPSSSARPIHISSDRFDHGGLVHSVSRKIRRVMRTLPPEELQSSRDCLFQLSILVSTSSVYFWLNLYTPLPYLSVPRCVGVDPLLSAGV